MFTERLARCLVRTALVAGTVIGLCGCLGPAGLRQTRSEYNAAIRLTNDEELVLNLVRLRYSEGPMFLRVTGVNAQFEMDATAQFVGGLSDGQRERLGTGFLGFSDRPTITFDPRRTPEFTRALITRIDLDTFSLLDAAGWDLSRSLRLFVENLNGIQNALSAGGPTPHVAPEFAEFKYLAGLLTHLYDERMIVLGEVISYAEEPTPVPLDRLNAQDLVAIKKAGYEVRSLAKNKGYVLSEPKHVRGLRVHAEATALPEWVEAMRILRLTPQQEFYPIELQPSGQLKPPPTNAQETKLTITTRSLLETMFLLSHNVAVAPEHVQKGLVTVTWNPDGTPFDWEEAFGDLFHVCVAKHKPKNAAISVKYRGYWYYIDDADIASRTTLTLFQEIIRLQKIGAAGEQPVLTLPVGR